MVKNMKIINYISELIEIKEKYMDCPYCDAELELRFARSRHADDNTDLTVYCPKCGKCIGGVATCGIVRLHEAHSYYYIEDEYKRLEAEMRAEKELEDRAEAEEEERIERRKRDTFIDSYKEYLGMDTTPKTWDRIQQDQDEIADSIYDLLGEQTAQLQDLREEKEAETKAEALYQLEQSRNDANTPA